MKGCFKIQNYKLLSINTQKHNHFIFLNPSLLRLKNLKLHNSLMNAIFSTPVLKFKLFFVLFLLKYHWFDHDDPSQNFSQFRFFVVILLFFCSCKLSPSFFFISQPENIFLEGWEGVRVFNAWEGVEFFQPTLLSLRA